MLLLLRVQCILCATCLSVLWALQTIHKWHVKQNTFFLFWMLSHDLFFSSTLLCTVMLKTWEYQLWFDIRSATAGVLKVETLHKSNEERVHRQTKCHQSDHLPGFRSKAETSRNLAHICFLWRQWAKVMKSLTREAGSDGGRESRWFQLESYR